MTRDPAVLRLDRPADELAPVLIEAVARLSPAVCGRSVAPGDPQHGLYVDRVRTCVEYHAPRLAEGRSTAMARVVERLESGDLGAVKVRHNLVRDVVLAQALQLGEGRAAELFDVEYAPIVRAIARHLGGERAVDAVENFAAELVLPREGRGPRIGTYQGRTSLAHWLGPVVANAWRSQVRRKTPEALAVVTFHEPAVGDDVARALDEHQCEGLLGPIFRDSCRALEAEDRLLLQMLVLDGVPQKDLARSLGLNSGTITRRRQRAAELLLGQTRRLAAASCNPRQADDCLRWMLAADDAELGRRLGQVLAEGLRRTAGHDGED